MTAELENLKTENIRLSELVKVLEEQIKSLNLQLKLERELAVKQELNNQKTIYNPFAPWTNCCNSIMYSDGFNPQANWCKNLE